MLKRPRTANLMSLLLVASVAGPALGLGLLAWVTYHRAFVDARRELAWTCAVALEHAAKVFDSYDLVVDRVQDALLGADPSDIARREGSFHDRFREMIAALPQVQSLVVLDRDGRAQVATQAYPVDRFVDFADRDYFQALKAGGSRTFISRLQTSLLTGKTFFGWGRARHDGQDDFDGVVDIAIDPEFFDRFYATLVRDVGGSVDGRVVTMIRSDGQILLRYPSFQGPPPMVSASNPFFEAVRADPDGGTYRSASVIDSGAPKRLFAYRKVPGDPLYLVAGRSLDAITSEWRHDMLRYMAVGLPGAAVLFLLVLATQRGARREQQALAQVRAEMDLRSGVEDQLRQAQKLEVIGQLTGGVAHDFNNFLTVIRSSVDLLKRPDLKEERRIRYIEAISEATTRAAKLTAQLLAFARRQALKPVVFDVVDSLRALEGMIATIVGSRIRIVALLPETPCYVHADPSQFDSSLVNMAVNARDAMAATGVMTIEVAAVARIPRDRLHPEAVGSFIAVSMTDTGTGIASDMIEKIFDPFFTTKGVGHGTGLGLSQVFGFVKQTGGEIRVTSEVGTGTTFTLYFPKAPPGMVPVRPVSEVEAVVDGHGTCVLVVEDNLDVGAFATHTLAELGYRTVWVHDAEQALRQLSDEAGRFDVVFSDVVMPGMNGIALGEEIRRRHPELPVVLASGYSHVLADHGSHGFELLQKPYSVEDLSKVLQRAAHWRKLRRVLDA